MGLEKVHLLHGGCWLDLYSRLLLDAGHILIVIVPSHFISHTEIVITNDHPIMSLTDSAMTAS